MSRFSSLVERPFTPDWRGLLDNIGRKGTPRRVYNIELFHDPEIIDAVVERFDLMAGHDPSSLDYQWHKLIAFQRFCGYDYARVQLDNFLTMIDESRRHAA